MALESRLLTVLTEHLKDPITAKSILTLSVERSRVNLDHLEAATREKFLSELKKGLGVFIREADVQAKCATAIEQALEEKQSRVLKQAIQTSVEIINETDVVLARNKGWYLCQQMDFPNNLKVTITTVITELARNILQYADKGKMELRALPGDPPSIQIVAHDFGPGITNLEAILAGRYKSTSGMGLGLKGVKQVMDEFDVQTAPGRGTTVTVKKYLK